MVKIIDERIALQKTGEGLVCGQVYKPQDSLFGLDWHQICTKEATLILELAQVGLFLTEP